MKHALFLNTSVTLSMGILWVLTIMLTDGRAHVNIYKEGWLEAAVFLGIGLYGLYKLRKGE